MAMFREMANPRLSLLSISSHGPAMAEVAMLFPCRTRPWRIHKLILSAPLGKSRFDTAEPATIFCTTPRDDADLGANGWSCSTMLTWVSRFLSPVNLI